MPLRRSAALGCLASFCLLAVPARGETVMRLASATIGDVQHEWQKEFAQEIEERVGGALRVSIHPASELGPIPQMVAGVRDGSIESFVTPTAFLTEVDPRFEIFEVPGLFASPEEVAAVIHDPAYRDHLETLAIDRGLRVIGAIYNSPTVALTREPAPTLEAFRGKRIRTFASPLQTQPIEALGAIAVPLPLVEVMPQLRAGTLDGMLVGMPVLTAFGYDAVARNVTELGFAEIVSVDVVNERWFQGQPDTVREAIRAAGRAAEQAVFPWGVANVARSNATWLERGGRILTLPADERARMMEQFASIGSAAVDADPAVKAEYARLLAVLDAKRRG